MVLFSRKRVRSYKLGHKAGGEALHLLSHAIERRCALAKIVF